MSTTSKILAILTLIWSSAWGEGPARIDGGEYDFGQVVSNSTVAHTVWIHAVGSDTLILNDVKTGCGCLTSPWTMTTVLPGDSLSLLFYWQTRGFVGGQNFSAYLYLTPENFPQEIKISGNVVTPDDIAASVDWRPSIVRLSVSPKAAPSASFELTNRTAEKLTPAVVESSPGLTVELPESIEPGKSAAGRVRLETVDAVSAFEGSVTLMLTGNQYDGIRVSLPVQFGDFSFRPFFTTRKK